MYTIEVYPVGKPYLRGKKVRQRWNWRLRRGGNVMCGGTERGRKGEGGGFASRPGCFDNLMACAHVFGGANVKPFAKLVFCARNRHTPDENFPGITRVETKRWELGHEISHAYELDDPHLGPTVRIIVYKGTAG